MELKLLDQVQDGVLQMQLKNSLKSGLSRYDKHLPIKPNVTFAFFFCKNISIEFQVSIPNNCKVFYMFQILLVKHYKTLFTFWISEVLKNSHFQNVKWSQF